MSIYEEVEFEDLDYDPVTQIYTYPCPCGDKFSISLEALWDGEDIATCPSCTLRIEIIYDEEDLPPLRDDDDDESGGEEEEEEGEKKKQDEKGEEKKEGIDHNIASVLQKSLTVK
mmetsp:Transcript_17755/g.35573  ORF Transcript_17755/g.35573 Transcript_17755/m.35573 type:complete len:115 (+) Transcript_17755:133-477(+)